MNQIIKITSVLLVILAGGHPAQAQTHFTEVGHQAGVADSVGVNTYMAWMDYDNDGFLDLFVANGGMTIKGHITAEGYSVADSFINLSKPSALLMESGCYASR